ncbi:MAG: glycosyltransferase family 4 protein, partial [Actinomycetota bacterium]
RIALVCPYAWDDPGGVQVHVRELGMGLAGRGHHVIALAPVRGRSHERWVVPVGRPVDIPYNASNAPIDPRPWSRRRVRAVLERFAPDVVHAHEPLTPSTSMWATLVSEAPVVGTFHSGATRSRLFDLAVPLLRRVARHLAARVAVSEAAAGFARDRIGGEYAIVPNGVDVARFVRASPADLGGGTKLLFVGRLDARKGFPTAVEAFGMLATDRPELRLIVVGDGPDRGATASLPRALRDRITFLGAVPNRDLPPIHAACDLYLGPAAGGESFGVVLVEAMAAGLPVIASDIPGYDEVVRDGVDGLLVPPSDPAQLARVTARVLGEPALAERLAEAGRSRAASFDWDVVLGRLEGLYERAAQMRPRSLP